jgi:hypothetical protein
MEVFGDPGFGKDIGRGVDGIAAVGAGMDEIALPPEYLYMPPHGTPRYAQHLPQIFPGDRFAGACGEDFYNFKSYTQSIIYPKT